MLKTCKKCQKQKPFTSFSNRKKSKDGKAYSCKECRKIIERRYKDTRNKINNHKTQIKLIHIRQLKATTPCKDCNKFFPYYYVLDFDHLTKKNYKISLIARSTHSLEYLKNEINKCDLVCANCHRNRTHERKRNKVNSNVRVEKNKQIINKLKMLPCTDCGLTYNPWQMDFDHLDSSQKIDNISELLCRGVSISKIKQEIEKCELVCVNCHRIRTFVKLNEQRICPAQAS